MSTIEPPTWSFLTNYARVLLCIAEDPGIRLRELGDRWGLGSSLSRFIAAVTGQ